MTTASYCNGFGRIVAGSIYVDCTGCLVCRERKRRERQRLREQAKSGNGKRWK